MLLLPKRRFLATAGEGVVRLWSTADWSRKAEGEFNGEVGALMFGAFCDRYGRRPAFLGYQFGAEAVARLAR